MRWFIYSFVSGVALFAAMKSPFIAYTVGLIGAVPLAGLSMPFENLQPATVSKILVITPASIAILSHIAFRRRERALRDSVFTIFAALWVAYSISEFQLLCSMGSDWAAIQNGACSGIPGGFSRSN